MAGGTLVVSRAGLLHTHIKNRLEALGFDNVAVTAVEKDGLNMLISDLKPRLVIMGAGFYQSATPYMAGDILRRFRGLNIAVVSCGQYPADYGMAFIANGVKSYIAAYDGIEQFYEGLVCVREGKSFISPSVRKRMEIRDELPRPSTEITDRELEVLRCVRNGFTGPEIAMELAVSLRTVNFHKQEMYSKFSVRNENELVRVADYLKLIKQDEPVFYGRKYELKPKPSKKKEKKQKNAIDDAQQVIKRDRKVINNTMNNSEEV
jgi:DNA-binding NarL/FixJ family response regulator